MSDVLKRIAAKTVKGEGKKACWLFVGHINVAGYGCVSYHGKPRLAHRVVAEEHKLLMASWQYVTHTCKQNACVRPDHLRVLDHRPLMPPQKTKRAKMRAQGKVRVQYTVPSRKKGKRGKRVTRWVTPAQAKRIEAKYKPRAPRERFCAHCQKSMGTRYVRNKYCGQACINAAYFKAHPDPVLPPCRVCGGPVAYNRQSDKQSAMCGKACRRIWQSAHLAGVRPSARTYLRHCMICNAQYALRQRRDVRTCGKACAGKLRWRRRRKECVICQAVQGTRTADGEIICPGACCQKMADRVQILIS